MQPYRPQIPSPYSEVRGGVDFRADIDAGSDCPGIKMVRGDELVEIYLIAPFEGEYRIKVNFKNHNFKIRYYID